MSRYEVFSWDVPPFDPAGPGTPEWRFDMLLMELEKRFPTPTKERTMMGPPPEQYYLKKIDEMIEKAWMYDDLCK